MLPVPKWKISMYVLYVLTWGAKLGVQLRNYDFVQAPAKFVHKHVLMRKFAHLNWNHFLENSIVHMSQPGLEPWSQNTVHYATANVVHSSGGPWHLWSGVSVSQFCLYSIIFFSNFQEIWITQNSFRNFINDDWFLFQYLHTSIYLNKERLCLVQKSDRFYL